MLGGVLNVFIALAMTFAATALLASTAVEAIASAFKWRAANLLEGLQYILNAKTPPEGLMRWLMPYNNLLPKLDASAVDAQRAVLAAVGTAAAQDEAAVNKARLALNSKLLADLLNHAAINARGPGNDAQASASAALMPSYIPPKQFAIALVDVLQTGGGAERLSLEQAIANIADPQLKQFLSGAFERAAGNAEKLRDEVATWFNAAMDRLGGQYKRYTQVWTVFIGFAAAAAFNIDTIKIVHAAMHNPILLANVQTSVSADALDHIKSLSDAGIAVGWSMGPGQLVPTAVANPGLAFMKLLGWAMTALAALFGAPFWFDTLQRFVSLRGTGDPPPSPAP